jgi:succinate-acetate transporter protein
LTQDVSKSAAQWANPGALGLAAFGLNTILLQLHNVVLIENTLPLFYGIFWGGLAQVIAGIIEGKRGDTFGLTAFLSYGIFWIGLCMAFVFQWSGLVKLDDAGLGWVMVMWGVFTLILTIGTFKITWVHITVFSLVTVLFFLLAAHYFWGLSPKVPGVEGIISGAVATYGAAAIILNDKYQKTVCPMGVCK